MHESIRTLFNNSKLMVNTVSVQFTSFTVAHVAATVNSALLKTNTLHYMYMYSTCRGLKYSR